MSRIPEEQLQNNNIRLNKCAYANRVSFNCVVLTGGWIMSPHRWTDNVFVITGGQIMSPHRWTDNESSQVDR